MAGAVGKDKVVKRLSLGSSELAKGFRQRRDEVWFKHSLWLQVEARLEGERLELEELW